MPLSKNGHRDQPIVAGGPLCLGSWHRERCPKGVTNVVCLYVRWIRYLIQESDFIKITVSPHHPLSPPNLLNFQSYTTYPKMTADASWKGDASSHSHRARAQYTHTPPNKTRFERICSFLSLFFLLSTSHHSLLTSYCLCYYSTSRPVHIIRYRTLHCSSFYCISNPFLSIFIVIWYNCNPFLEISALSW